MIRRVYTHPSHSYSKRHFCGYCGTPLSYWSEDPRSEAEYISLTLGSLLREDIGDLEDMGLIPDASDLEDESDEDQRQQKTILSSPRPSSRSTALRQSYGVPWFDSLVEGTRLGKMRRSRGVERSHDGRVRVEWEVVEFGDDDAAGDLNVDTGMVHPGKRKRDSSDVAAGTRERS